MQPGVKASVALQFAVLSALLVGGYSFFLSSTDSALLSVVRSCSEYGIKCMYSVRTRRIDPDNKLTTYSVHCRLIRYFEGTSLWCCPK